MLNQTGIEGEFDITMKYDRDVEPGDPTDVPPRPGQLFGTSFFKAFEEQLGLKFGATKGPVEVIVIDHVDRPSEN